MHLCLSVHWETESHGAINYSTASGAQRTARAKLSVDAYTSIMNMSLPTSAQLRHLTVFAGNFCELRQLFRGSLAHGNFSYLTLADNSIASSFSVVALFQRSPRRHWRSSTATVLRGNTNNNNKHTLSRETQLKHNNKKKHYSRGTTALVSGCLCCSIRFRNNAFACLPAEGIRRRPTRSVA